ncbi:hypothetical protein GOBAR_AA20830 [Gossypium barbadense]|uniref:SWIM-type domain-containing protein n=1 Tax=Gossypium barbadense TaxID=3634 RepID=A0A2P5X932_GOSBA|nr:hypothetical protein GOBAR_AA20830 [Gossypium barbadense]
MDELRKTNHHAYDWLKKKNPAHWSRFHFSIRSHFDMLVNNLSESFNKMILEARGKPILTMMETVRTKLCYLLSRRKKKLTNGKELCSQHVVDLVQNSCSCRNWDLTSIPCMHALAVIDASLSNMLPILPPPLRRPPGRPTKVRRKELDEPQTTERLSKRGVEMRYSKCKIIGHNKRSCKGEVGQNIPVKRHQVGDRTQQQATPSQQEGTPTQ